MFESIPKDVLGWLAIVLAMLSVVLAYLLKSKGKGMPVRILQGGTNPNVSIPATARGVTDGFINATLNPGAGDKGQDSYIVQAWRIRPKYDGTDVTFEFSKDDIDGIKGKAWSGTVTFSDKPEENATPQPFKIPLQKATDNDIVAFAIYRKNGTRSNIACVEILK